MSSPYVYTHSHSVVAVIVFVHSTYTLRVLRLAESVLVRRVYEYSYSYGQKKKNVMWSNCYYHMIRRLFAALSTQTASISTQNIPRSKSRIGISETRSARSMSPTECTSPTRSCVERAPPQVVAYYYRLSQEHAPSIPAQPVIYLSTRTIFGWRRSNKK